MTLTPRWIAVRRKSPPFTGIAAALVATALVSGCYSPMYSQPYGQPYGQPAYPGTMQPGQPYYPGVQGGATLGNPTFSDPGASGSSSDAPFYGSPSPTTNRPVPDAGYSDSGVYSPPSGTAGGTSSDTSGLGADGDFMEPRPAGQDKEISLTREVKNIAEQQYAFDTGGHRWLQGVVSFDPSDKSWGIVYSIDPSPSDPHNGYLTLVNDARLAALKDGDVVRLEGQVIPERLDFSGRPSYEVTTITHISR